MADKRRFYCFVNYMKETYPDHLGLIESIQEKFDEKFENITDRERKALKQNPIQFVKRIPEEHQEWTTQLHIWGEHGVSEILKLDPIFLAFKNSYGDSVLMCLTVGATGAYTEKINYNLIEEILNTDFSYEDITKDPEGNDVITVKNALEEKDINDKTATDFLIDFAYGKGEYEGEEPNEKIQELLKKFTAPIDQKSEENFDDVKKEIEDSEAEENFDDIKEEI